MRHLPNREGIRLQSKRRGLDNDAAEQQPARCAGCHEPVGASKRDCACTRALGTMIDDTGPLDDRGVAHGVRSLEVDENGDQSCGWNVRDTFKCRNCGRTCCYCKGHGDCALCDECCARPKCLGTD